jgi:hypothetical protein
MSIDSSSQRLHGQMNQFHHLCTSHTPTPVQCAEWSLNLMSNGSQRLRDLEKAAKLQRLGIWAKYVAPPTNQVRTTLS